MKSIHTLDNCSSVEFSPILTCIKSIQGSEALWGSEKMNLFKRLSFKELKKEQNLKCEDGFCFAVSLQDGSTLYISSAITKHLGYPKDMLVGQCIMNFLYQKDHITFANHLTQGLNACFTQGNKDESHLVPNTFFCRLRVHHGLKFGYGVSQKKTQYKPFKVTLHINDLIFDDVCVEKMNSMLCVKATATPLSSAYQIPEEIPAMTSFSTRHTASCHFSHVDASAIPYLGYLPQDMIGYSIFDFYHTDDLPHLKEIYELVIKEQGSSFRSKPYRFKVFNGCYITLETEWSCFINPWSRKLEFVVGQHRVVKGPTDISIFNPCNFEEAALSEETHKECLIIQKEIRNLLSQPIKDCSIDKTKQISNKRKRDLASFVYKFIDEGCRRNKEDDGDEKCSTDDGINSDPDSVVMGDISPHQDSSTFSETPPTCQEIRFQENMERFFASQPNTTFSDGSEESKSDEKLSNSDESGGNRSKQQDSLPSTSGSNVPYTNKRQESSSTSSKGNFSYLTNGDSGYKSLDKDQTPSVGVSDTSKNCTWEKYGSIGDADKFPPCMTLTEEVLSQHNRLNHKYIKHRKFKGNTTSASGHKESSRMKHNESGHSNAPSSVHKPKKFARIQCTTSSAVTQTDNVRVTTSQERQPPFSVSTPFSFNTFALPMSPFPNASAPSAPTSPAYPSFAVPSYPYISPTGTPGTTPTPVFIPVMYMGPCLPPLTNVMPTNALPVWPYPPVAPHPFSTPAVFPAPVIPAGGTVPVPLIPTPQGATPSSMYNVQSSGVTTTTTVLKTTTSVAPGVLVNAQNPSSKMDTTHSTHLNQKGNDSNDSMFDVSKDCISVIDDSSFSLTSSPTRTENQSKNEEMEFDPEFDKKCQRPIRQDPPWLTGVDLTSDVVYRYKMEPQSVEDVLMKDMEALKCMTQPELVNKQLDMLHQDYNGDMKAGISNDDDYHMSDSALLGLTTESDENQELEDCEDSFFNIMAENI